MNNNNEDTPTQIYTQLDTQIDTQIDESPQDYNKKRSFDSDSETESIENYISPVKKLREQEQNGNNDYHDYDYHNIDTCLECKRIHDKYGDTEAQIDMPHFAVPIKGGKLRKRIKSRKNKKSKSLKKGTKKSKKSKTRKHKVSRKSRK